MGKKGIVLKMTNQIVLLLLLSWHNVGGNVCWSVTNYWPWDGGINCMEPCDQTANGLKINPEMDWQIAAAPLPLMNSTIIFSNGTEVQISDTFGKASYQHGAIVHEQYGRVVIPLDIMTQEPLHYLDCTIRLDYGQNAPKFKRAIFAHPNRTPPRPQTRQICVLTDFLHRCAY